MSAVRVSKNQRLVRTLGLLASASVMPIMMSGEAQAACTATPAQPLTNVTTPGTTIDCSGVNTGQTIAINADNVILSTSGAGVTFDNSTITVNGAGNSIDLTRPTSVANLVFNSTSGSAAVQSDLFIRNATNLTATLNGNFQAVQLRNGNTALPGNITFLGAATDLQSLHLIGSLTGTANNGAASLITGGGGRQLIDIDGTLNVQSNGLAIATGAGDDQITIGTGANFAVSGGINAMVFDGGADADTIFWNGGSAAITRNAIVTNIETAQFSGGTGGLTMRGNSGYNNAVIGSGTVRFDDLAAMGSNTAAIIINTNGRVELNQFGAQSLNHAFTGTGTLSQGIGTYTYGGDSANFSGTFNLNSANATLTNANAMGTANIVVNSGGLTFGDFTLANSISGSGGLNKVGPGIGALTGDNSSFGGTINIDGGTLLVTNVTALGTAGIQSFVTPGILQLDLAGDQVLANDLDGDLSLVKNGAGVLDVTGNNQHVGGTTINAGAIRVDEFARLGTGAILANAGGSLILNHDSASQLLQTTPFMTGAGSFIKEGTGDVVMDVASAYTGGTIIRAGRIGLNNGAALGTGNIQVDAGAQLGIGGVTLANSVSGSGLIVKTANNQATLSGNNSAFTGLFDVQDGGIELTDGRSAGSGDLAIASGSYIFVNSNIGDTTIAADISGAGDLENFSNTRLILTGNNSLSGVVFISNGTLQIEGSQNVGTANINILGSGARLDLHTAGNTTLSNDVAGNGSVVKTGTGTAFLTGTNSYAGGTDIQQGAIRVTDVSFLGTGSITVQSGAALDLSIAGQQTLNQSISGAGILRKSDIGDLTLLGNSLTGGVDIIGGRVIVSTSAALGGGPVTTAADTQLVFNNSTAEGISNLISGAGTLTKDGTGLLAVNTANSYTGGTLVNSGRLVANADGAFGTGTVIVLSGAEIGVGGVVLVNNISGAGRVIKTANNTADVTGNNSYSGGTDIQAGAFRVNSPSALGTGGVTMASGAFLQLNYNGASNVALNNVLSGDGFLVKDGSGTVVINTFGNSYSGGTTINAGRIGLNFGDGLGTGSVLVNAGAVLGIGGITVTNMISGAGRVVKTANNTGSLTGINSYSGGTDIQQGTLAVDNASALGTGAVEIASGASLGLGDIAYANTTSGAGQIVKTSAGLTALTGTNMHSGGVDIQSGILDVAGNAGLGTGTVNIGSGANLRYTNASASTFSNGLSGTGTFNKLGAGQLTFANNFTVGALSLQAGRTRMNVVGTTNVFVNAGATLDGTGRIIGNLANNGIVAPGNSIGTLTVQGNYTHNANSILEIEFDGAGNIDLLDVTGNATLNGGTLRFVSIGGAEGSGGTFLRTGGALMGTFATVETVGAQLPLAVIYEPNRAFMAPSVLTARPSTFNAQSMAAADAALGFVDSIGLGDIHHGAGNRIWMQGFGAWGQHSASGTTLAYDHDTHGIGGGVNFDAGTAITMGVALGWAKGDIALGSNGGGGEQSSILGSAHARYSGNGFSLGGGLLFGKVDQETVRNVSFNGFAASVGGDTDSKVFGGFAELGLPLGSSSGWAFSANARGSYIRQKQDAYTESSASPLRLSVGALKTSTMEGQAKLTAKTSLWAPETFAEDHSQGLDLRIDLGARYLGSLGNREIPVTFAASNAGIILQGDTRNTLQGQVGLAVDYETRRGTRFSLGYKGEIGKTDRHAVQAGVSFAF